MIVYVLTDKGPISHIGRKVTGARPLSANNLRDALEAAHNYRGSGLPGLGQCTSRAIQSLTHPRLGLSEERHTAIAFNGQVGLALELKIDSHLRR